MCVCVCVCVCVFFYQASDSRHWIFDRNSHSCLIWSRIPKAKNMYLAFRFSPATSVCRFICSSLVIPADNCQLVAPLLRDQLWWKAQVYAQSWVWSGHKQCPAWQLLVETSEKNSSLPSLCWGRCLREPGNFPVVLSVSGACTLEQSAPKLNSPGACVSKQLGVAENDLVILSRDHCYTLPTFLEESGQYRLFCW